MADGFLGSGAGDLFRSRILGQALEDTPYPQQAVWGMLGGATPEQLRAFYASPQVQQQFKSFGIDPQQFLNTRQSPFFSNAFMGHHPMLGGALTSGLANMAMTPEAPLVSGAGSGLTRAAQGLRGGPDMLRQFQLHQLMAPMGAMASMMPTYGEQRRKALDEAIIAETQQRMKALPMQQQIAQEQQDARRMLAEAAETRAGAAADAAHRPQVHFGPVGTGRSIIQDVPYQPAGGPQGLDFQLQGQGHPLMMLTGPQAGQALPMPGWGLTPEQQAGWREQYVPYSQTDIQGEFGAKAAGSQTPEKADLLKSQAEQERAKAEDERAKAASEGAKAKAGGKDQAYWEKRYDDVKSRYLNRIDKLKEWYLSKDITDEQKASVAQQIDELNRQWESENAQIDAARGAPGASTKFGPETHYTPEDKSKPNPKLSPGAKSTTGTTTSGSTNAGRGSETTATW